MAASRWKRFAFFDRNNLTLQDAVIQDLIPNHQTNSGSSSSISIMNSSKSSTRSAGNRMLLAQDPGETVSMVVSTASLPVGSSPMHTTGSSISMAKEKGTSMQDIKTKGSTNSTQSASSSAMPTTAMWNSLTACMAPDQQTGFTEATQYKNTVQLASQAQHFGIHVHAPSSSSHHRRASSSSTNNGTTTTTAVDGLVLVFMASQESDRVHCVDVTMRCNPPNDTSITTTTTTTTTTTSTTTTDATATVNSTTEEDSLDGWRGFWTPFAPPTTTPTTTTTGSSSATSSRLEDRIVSEHLGTSIHSTHRHDCIMALATCRIDKKLWVACLAKSNLILYADPHLDLSCRIPLTTKLCTPDTTSNATNVYRLAAPWNTSTQGTALCMDMEIIAPVHSTTTTSISHHHIMIAVGTDSGLVHVYSPQKGFLRSVLTIHAPSQHQQVTSLQWSVSKEKVHLFVIYHAKAPSSSSNTRINTNNSNSRGICCFELGSPTNTTTAANQSTSVVLLSQPLARHDLDSRSIPSSRLCDKVPAMTNTTMTTAAAAAAAKSNASNNATATPAGAATTATDFHSGASSNNLLVARADGLYTYSPTHKVSVAPLNGIKLVLCNISLSDTTTVSLVASTDAKSGRDAVDIYDASNKLVPFHVLLSPAHKAMAAVGWCQQQDYSNYNNATTTIGSRRGRRSSAIVWTSGGALVTLTEKVTREKVSLLTKKNLYGAAISMAFADSTYPPTEITALYRKHAEHLYRKGDFSAAMEQYIYTIGSLESSHVIFRYLDAPKIPMLTKYLEELRSRGLATTVHNELLRTCYLKLGDTDAADAAAAPLTTAVGVGGSGSAETTRRMSSSMSGAGASTSSTAALLATLSPKEALATVCSLEAPQAAEAIVLHGAVLARSLPRETAGVVVSLCLGTYSPSAMASHQNLMRLLETPIDPQERSCTPYPVHLFASCFLENPKMLRLILAHCNRCKCTLTPTLRRTLLELTLAEWNTAKRCGDTEAEKLRRKEAITAMTDAHCHDIGDYNALVLCQLANFGEGELLLYERLQMVPMLLARYAQDGGDRARRQMLAMCRLNEDPQVLADVLGHFVTICSQGGENDTPATPSHDLDGSLKSHDDSDSILDDIREALALARTQGVLPPVRMVRILAGEGTGQFSEGEQHVAMNNKSKQGANRRTVPLTVALEYVGDILDESRTRIAELQSEVEEYTTLCATMEQEVETLLSGGGGSGGGGMPLHQNIIENGVDVDELYHRLQASLEDGPKLENKTMQAREAFWREMDQSDDRFETIARYFAKGLIQ